METMLWVVGGLWVVAGSLFTAASRGARGDEARFGVRRAGEQPAAWRQRAEWGL